MNDSHQTGSAKVRLDERGRLAVPNRFRDGLRHASGFVLTAHPHACLVIYSTARFADIRRQFAERPNLAYFDAHLEELIIGSAEELQLDSAERFLINPQLRDYAGIGRDIRMFSLPDAIRVWSEERWEQKHSLMMARLQDEEFSATWQDLRI